MATTQPPVIVAIDGKANVTVSNTEQTPVPVSITNQQLAVLNPNLVGLPEIFRSTEASKALFAEIVDIGLSPAMSSTPVESHGTWVKVVVEGKAGWINTNAVTDRTCVLWRLR